VGGDEIIAPDPEFTFGNTIDEDDELADFFASTISAKLEPPVELVSARDRTRGHHYLPREVFKRYNLPGETRNTFENARTGAIPDPVANYYDSMHRT
jgi:hypothetical protein